MNKTTKPQKTEAILAVFSERAMTYNPLARDLSGVIFQASEDDVKKLGLKTGNIVNIIPAAKRANKAPSKAKALEIVFDKTEGNESALTVLSAGIPTDFPEAVIKECDEIKGGLSKKEIFAREDLRALPFVTIDGEYAKDFDDAVFAEKIKKGKLAGGFHIIVAIADVALYVKKGSALEKEAMLRGNSTYLPDMVIPMLPEKLCNDLCSLVEGEDRPVVAAHLYIDRLGNLKNFKFSRAVIKSKKRLTYSQVQQTLNADFTGVLKEEFFEEVILPLALSYDCLKDKREQRGALDLDTVETRLVLDDDKNVLGIIPTERFEAHMIIEELMILANVAAAKALAKATCMYRVHEEPTTEKLSTLEKSLKGLRVKHKVGKKQSPHDFKNLIDKIRRRSDCESLMMVILRSQAQAAYASENIGHFGLALTHYAHFTSPIRRFSDLVVHRSLISNLKLASSGGLKYSNKKIDSVAEHINITERVSQKAEWDCKERFMAKYYSDKIDKEFKATVVSVNNFGLFVKLADSAAEGLLPLRAMTNDYYFFDENTSTLRGRRTRKTVRIGTNMRVKVASANVDFGKLSFEFVRFI
ncbi:MAG: VacB/RNase II family 3'-5' exoribonuclease [Proteobacteria bacterium]|nr:VacB/RNase II family 3'-5' exoribonuclease [Pseudomonadota bacterium]